MACCSTDIESGGADVEDVMELEEAEEVSSPFLGASVVFLGFFLPLDGAAHTLGASQTTASSTAAADDDEEEEEEEEEIVACKMGEVGRGEADVELATTGAEELFGGL